MVHWLLSWEECFFSCQQQAKLGEIFLLEFFLKPKVIGRVSHMSELEI